jgi:hypothetical protein
MRFRPVRCVWLLVLVLVGTGCDWAMFGYGPEHTRYNPTENAIGVANVAGLSTAWTAVTGEGIFSSPAVAKGTDRLNGLLRKPHGVPCVLDCGCRQPRRPIITGGGERSRLHRIRGLRRVYFASGRKAVRIRRCRFGRLLRDSEGVCTPVDGQDRWRRALIAGRCQWDRVRGCERWQGLRL